ncbi:hypothetical protein [Streptomyces sp. NPDC101132]|uniref:hypothetical protein n=1 Tax=Streptomyces sp. NPDC101132 TaxID=3366110 RepID=UPI0038186319
MRIHHATTLAAAAALLALTGCTSESEPTNASPSGSATLGAEAIPDEQARTDLEAAVYAYSDSYFKPDGDAAYRALSKRCAKKAGPQEVFAGIVDTAAKAYGKQEIKSFAIDQLAGDMARVSYTYAVPKLNQSQQPWTREGGVWKYDGC